MSGTDPEVRGAAAPIASPRRSLSAVFYHSVSIMPKTRMQHSIGITKFIKVAKLDAVD